MTRHTVASIIKALMQGLDPSIPISDQISSSRRDQYLQELIDLGADAVEPLIASKVYASAPVLRVILEALGGIGTWPAIRSLMRYLFDTRNDLTLDEARSIAAKGLVTQADEKYREPYQSFVQEMWGDDDRWVQSYLIDMVGKLKMESMASKLMPYVNGQDALLKEHARAALFKLSYPESTPNLADSLTPEQRRFLNDYRYASTTKRRVMRDSFAEIGFVAALQYLCDMDPQGVEIALVTLLEMLPQWKNEPNFDQAALRHFVAYQFRLAPHPNIETLAMRVLTALGGFSTLPLDAAILKRVKQIVHGPKDLGMDLKALGLGKPDPVDTLSFTDASFYRDAAKALLNAVSSSS